jgi:predicted ATPase/class 3 adenylate cyclase
MLPTGTVTFVFTDIEDSTGLAQRLGDSDFSRLVDLHNSVIRAVVERHGGVEVATEGDAVFTVFEDPLAAVTATVDIQDAIDNAEWESREEPRVRIGVHTGQGSLGGDNYVGLDVHKASRIANCGNGAQILLSDTTAHLVEDRLPDGVTVRTLGRYRLSGFPSAVPIHQLEWPGSPGEYPELRAPRAESRVPVPLSDFIGREEEISRALAVLGESRLVTLTGPGGTGKTRLSLELARRVEPDLPDGAVFVTLAAVRDPDLIPATILDALGLKTAGGIDPLVHLERHLADKTMLLVIDNFEQVVRGAGIVVRILESAAGVKVLVSSRIPLRVFGEREFPVPPLDVPDPAADLSRVEESAGVRLFVTRAEAVRPGFHLDESNAGTVATIARSLDGLPLAIELAASRMRSLTPEAILERLDNRLLAADAPDRPQRQQTIVNAIGWSYDLLDEPTRRLFEDLSAFVGEFGLPEAEALCRLSSSPIDVIDGITHLVDHSLLRQTQTSGDPRFRMLTVIRDFGYGALVARGDEAEIVKRHGEVYLAVAESAAPEILTSRQQYWLRRLAADHDNLRAAYDRALDRGDVTTAMRLGASLWRFWQIRGHLAEGRERLERVLIGGGEVDPLLRARALTGMAGIIYWQGGLEELLPVYEEALDLFREHGVESDVAEGLYNLAFPCAYVGEIDRAKSLLNEAMDMWERIGDDQGVARALWGLGVVFSYSDDHERVIEHAARSVEVFEGLDAPFDLGWALFMEAQANAKLGRFEEAERLLARALEIFAGVSDVSALTLITEVTVLLAVAREDRAAAGFLAGAAHRLKADTGVEIGDVRLNQFPQVEAFLSERDEALETAFQEGFASGLDDVIARARALLRS